MNAPEAKNLSAAAIRLHPNDNVLVARGLDAIGGRRVHLRYRCSLEVEAGRASLDESRKWTAHCLVNIAAVLLYEVPRLSLICMTTPNSCAVAPATKPRMLTVHPPLGQSVEMAFAS